MAITFHIITIGKMKSGSMSDLYNDYIKRIDWPVVLHEVTTKSPLKTDEAKALIAKLPKNSKIIALDERGQTPSSKTFSETVQHWVDGGTQNITFVIGGADGLDDSILKWADYRLSFGRMTWPHMMVRVMLAEQIYRIRSIMKNHPYHRE